MVNATNFFKVESALQTASKEDSTAGIGLTTFGHPTFIKNEQQGLLASRERPYSTNGYLGTAVVANPFQMKGFAKSRDDEYFLITGKPGQPFTCYVGAGWDEAARFKTNAAWNELTATINWQSLNAFYKHSGITTKHSGGN